MQDYNTIIGAIQMRLNKCPTRFVMDRFRIGSSTLICFKNPPMRIVKIITMSIQTKMAGYDLLVIDDFGLMDLNLDKCRDLFEIIEARDCRKSTVIISQMPVANWYQLFGDNTYADACLSRMTSKAYRLDFPGRDRRVESK